MSTIEPNPKPPDPDRMTVPEGVGALLVIGGGVVVLFAVIDPHESSAVLASGPVLLVCGVVLVWLARWRSAG